MYIDKPVKPKRSLGALRKVSKTKPKSPDLTGQMKLQRYTAAAIVEEFSQDERSTESCATSPDGVIKITAVHTSPLSCRLVSFPERKLSKTTSLISLLMARRTTLKASDPATAFRLPKAILASVDAICAKEDTT